MQPMIVYNIYIYAPIVLICEVIMGIYVYPSIGSFHVLCSNNLTGLYVRQCVLWVFDMIPVGDSGSTISIMTETEPNYTYTHNAWATNIMQVIAGMLL